MFTYLEDSILFTTVKMVFISIIVLIHYKHTIFITGNKSCMNLSLHVMHNFYLFMISQKCFLQEVFLVFFSNFFVFGKLYLNVDCLVCVYSIQYIVLEAPFYKVKFINVFHYTYQLMDIIYNVYYKYVYIIWFFIFLVFYNQNFFFNIITTIEIIILKN